MPPQDETSWVSSIAQVGMLKLYDFKSIEILLSELKNLKTVNSPFKTQTKLNSFDNIIFLNKISY